MLMWRAKKLIERLHEGGCRNSDYGDGKGVEMADFGVSGTEILC
jgi:hypothetical protein